MKIVISGKTDKKLVFVKFVKELTGLSPYDSKVIVDGMFNGFKDSIVLDIEDKNYDVILKMFNESGLSDCGLILNKHRKEIIDNFLKDCDSDIENTEEYQKMLNAFNYIYKIDKNVLKVVLNDGLEIIKINIENHKL
jgi:hypothetical protein